MTVEAKAPKAFEPLTHGTRQIPLDALRGVAIALVIVHHVWWRFPMIHDDPLARFVAGIGWAGVDLFFGISGYLITTILMKSRGPDSIRSFFVKRFFRIVPIYLIAIGVFIVVSMLTGNDRDVLDRIWINLLLLTAWFIPFAGENGVPYTITWSVSVEEFAYLLLGGIGAMGAHLLIRSLAWIIISAFLLRIASIIFFAFEPITLYYFAPGRIDAIAMGGAMATLSQSMRERIIMPAWLPWGLWLVAVAVCSQMRRENAFVATIGYTAIAFASAWLVVCVANTQNATHWRLTRWLASLGVVSYFVYLFHGYVIGMLSKTLPDGAVLTAGIWGISLLAMSLTYAAARVSWRFFEHPLILMGRRIADRTGRRAT
ncbi:MAG: acyltransferase family protein [Nitrospira sp.]